MLKKSYSKKVRIIWATVAAVIIFISIFAAVVLKDKTIYLGISIDGIDVSGLDINTAQERLNDAIGRVNPVKKVVLEYAGNAWQYDFEELGIGFKIQNAIEEAYSIGRSGNIFYRLYSIIATRIKKHNIISQLHFDRNLMIQVLKVIKKDVDRQEMNAAVKFQQGKITIVGHETGKRLDINKNLDNWTSKLEAKNFTSHELIVEEVEPEIKETDINHIENIIGKFSTRFNEGDANRSYNIKLACSKINGILLMPGQNFSMNESLGPRTAANGYKEAPVIFKNELVKGTGGGVCQVTTTLYNAVLLSKLKVLERTHHSMPLGYVDMGRDATIAENYIDFKFRNSSGYPIAIFSLVKGNVIEVYILGKDRENGMKVVLKSQVVEKYEPQGEEVEYVDEIPENERVVLREPKTGYKVLLYREIYGSDGVLLFREKISEDVYAPVKAKVKVGRGMI
ncbi:VanW family protein [Pseudobacteroides cellulosolvens]|uniref:VanW family protein n=1 Tax=Pseudobacteroides cellulosolvens ATCC 35603 = DSM 2933 TaxID=398512 RepID=A0A0L6JS55_9FIRM|nr:VanW family protein [Pseudobacteroides cellulosolvens]KNY28212.1 VanW family protein [Pseudobacteroides cellulosolvens ATCC 35603 = DSM 2933]